MKKYRLLLLTAIACIICVLLCSCGSESLSAPGGFSLDEETQILSWTTVRGATGYAVKIGDTEEITNSSSYSLASLSEGVYAVTVKALGNGDDTADSDYSSYEYRRDKESGLSYKLIDGREYQLVGIGSASGDVIMESYYRNKPVTSISESALANSELLTSFRVCDGITSIPKKMFYKCTSLTAVYLPDSVTYIGANAFQSCKSLTDVDMSSAVSVISDYAFSYCDSLTSVALGDELVKIGDNAFADCPLITSVSIPNGVSEIGEYAFSGCQSLAEVILPDSLKKIGDHAFYKCGVLEKINMPKSLSEIGMRAFSDCVKLKSVELPTSLKVIGEAAFLGCTELASVTSFADFDSIGRDILLDTKYYSSYPNDIVYLDGWIIGVKDKDIKKDDDLYISDNTVGIADYAFYECGGFVGVYATSVKKVGDYAFAFCENLLEVRFGPAANEIGLYAFAMCESLYSVMISQTSLKRIESYLFYGCSELEDVVFPSTVTSVGACAFSGTGIKKTPEGVRYAGNWAVDANTDVSGVTLKPGTIGIADYTFSNRASIGVVTMPDTLKYIGKGAFLFCDYVYIYDVPESLVSIGDYAFYGCREAIFGKERTLELPNGFEYIGRSAFYESNIYGISIPGSCKTIGPFAFYGCKRLGACITVAELDENDQIIEGTEVTKRYYVVINEGVESIGSHAFYGCAGLLDITIPDSVTKLGEKAFYKCDFLTKVTLGSGITSIPECTFYEDKALIEVIFEGDITSIDNYAFRGCSALSSISLKSSLECIGSYAFLGCESLETIELPDTLTYIGDMAFAGMTKLASVTVSDNTTHIGRLAFYECEALTIYLSCAEIKDSWDSLWNASFCSLVFRNESGENQ